MNRKGKRNLRCKIEIFLWTELFFDFLCLFERCSQNRKINICFVGLTWHLSKFQICCLLMECHGNGLPYCLFFLSSFLIYFRTRMKPKKPSESEFNVFNTYIASCKLLEVATCPGPPQQNEKQKRRKKENNRRWGNFSLKRLTSTESKWRWRQRKWWSGYYRRSLDSVKWISACFP